MQLSLTRSQRETTDRKGRPSGTEFVLNYRLVVTPDERSTIERYGLGSRYVVGDITKSATVSHTIERLLRGDSYTASTTDGVLEFEQVVLKGARNAAALVSQVAAFDGRERVIELSSSPSAHD